MPSYTDVSKLTKAGLKYRNTDKVPDQYGMLLISTGMLLVSTRRIQIL